LTTQDRVQKEMTISHGEALSKTRRAREKPIAWDAQIAAVISHAGSPPVLASAVMLLAAATSPVGVGAWIWSLVYLLLAVVLPVLRLIWLVRQGWITDLDVQLRKQRIGPLLHALALGGAACVLMMLGEAPAGLNMLALTLWALQALILGITLRWKISVHSTISAVAALFVGATFGLLWLPLTGVLLIAWSRVRLRRHTVAQVAAGVALGAVVAGLALAVGGV
jgi:membrane-associated phospholipid phosphatase